jgi:hypothetical protein
LHDAWHIPVNSLLSIQHAHAGQGEYRRTGSYSSSTMTVNEGAFSPPSHGLPALFARAHRTQPTLRTRAPCARARPRRRCAPGHPLRRHPYSGAPRPRPSQRNSNPTGQRPPVTSVTGGRALPRAAPRTWPASPSP